VSKVNKRERQKENRERARVERERLMKRDQRMRLIRNLVIAVVLAAVVILVVQLLKGNNDSKSSSITRTYKSAPPNTIDPNKTYTANIETSKGTIVVKLDAKNAPVATNNFVFLAKNKFYDGLCIDRAVTDFVIQGGSPKCDQQGGPGYSVKGEVPKNHYPVGSLAAAKAGNEPDGTMGSQIFIVTGSQGATLPNQYARFGSVTSGMPVAKSIEKLAPPGEGGKPTEKVSIDKITITES
jgi:cyclophilin family peptidyl-prolyl cis-trans isomerase